MCPGVVAELQHQRVLLEHLLDDGPLNALAAAVDQPKLCQAGLMSGTHVLFDDRWNVARRERVQIELAFNRNANGVGHG